MRRVIRYQTSNHPLSTSRWRRKRKVAGAKQSIRRSRGGPPPSSRIRWWRRWPSTQRLKVTYGLPGRKSSRHSRAPFHTRIISSRMLVTGSETSTRHAGLRDDFFRAMTGDSSSVHDHLGSPFPTLPHNRYGTIRFSMILLWIDKETLHPKAAGGLNVSEQRCIGEL